MAAPRVVPMAAPRVVPVAAQVVVMAAPQVVLVTGEVHDMAEVEFALMATLMLLQF